MASTEHSERKRLYPVIATIMKLTSQEKGAIEVALAATESESLQALTSTVSSWFGGT